MLESHAYRCWICWPTAAGLVASRQVNLDGLITGRFGLDDVEQALNADQNPGSLKTTVVLT